MANVFIKKDLNRLIADANDPLASEKTGTLKRHLSALNLTLLGVGGIIGAGIFSITGTAAANYAGPGIVYSFIIGGILCAFAGLCYAEMAAMVPVSGSAYAYSYATLGELVAWIIGWDLVLEYAVASAVVAVAWSGYVTSFLRDIGINIPPQFTACWYDPLITLANGTQVHGIVNVPAMFIIVVISLLLMLGIKESASVNDVIVLIKLAVVVTFIIVGFHYLKPSNYVPFIPPNTGNFGEFGFSGIMRAAGIIFLPISVLIRFQLRLRKRIIPKETSLGVLLDP